MEKKAKAAIVVRLDPPLLDRFNATCQLADRPAAQVVRELIRRYIAEQTKQAQTY